MAASTVDDMVERLRRHGLRATTPRRIIVETLVEHAGHVTADDLTTLVQARAPHVNKATVYRTLEALEALDEVYRMALDQGPAQWHLADHAHQHLVCSVCGDVSEVASPAFGQLASALRDAYGFQVDARHVAISGRCRACAR